MSRRTGVDAQAKVNKGDLMIIHKHKKHSSLIRRIAVICGMLLATVFIAPISAHAEATPVDVANETQLREALSNASAPADITIRFTGDVKLTSSLKIPAGKTVSFTDDGTARKITYSGITSTSIPVIEVPEGTTFNLKGKNLAIDGSENGSSSYVIKVHGTFTMEAGSIVNTYTGPGWFQTDNYNSVVSVDGANAKFTMSGGNISHNHQVRTVGTAVVTVTNGAHFRLTGNAKISDNSLLEREDGTSVDLVNADRVLESKDVDKHINAPVWVIPQGESRFAMDGGSITNNNAGFAGGVLIGYSGQSNGAGHAHMDFTGGVISNNKALLFGGGVFLLTNPGKVASLSMGGNAKIIGNEAPSGGGVAIFDSFALSQPDKDEDKDAYNKYLAGFPAYKEKIKGEGFTMTGGEISGNTARLFTNGPHGAVGGGIYVASDNVKITGGAIKDNVAEEQGGGIYIGTIPYTVKIDNALVTGNHASIMGGGIWLCPTGEALSSIKNGGAIFDNTADKTGADVASVKKQYETKLYLSNMMLGNWLTTWYNDGGLTQGNGSAYDLGHPDPDVKRYDAMNAQEREAAYRGGIIESEDNLTLKSVPGEQGKKVARENAKVFITGNKAPRGAGIGTNGNVQFGEKPVNYPKVNISITKEWKGDEADSSKRPKSVKVGLFEGDKQIAEQSLSADNNWTYNWKDLPKFGSADPAEAAGKVAVTYTVKELDPDPGYTVAVSEDTDTSDSFAYTVTNTLNPTPPPTPDKPTPTPDKPKPTKPGKAKLVASGYSMGEYLPAMIGLATLLIATGVLVNIQGRKKD